MDWLLAFFAGIGIGWLLHESVKPIALRRAYRFEYRPPVSVEPTDDNSQWLTYLASFGLQCALADITSERAVVAAGIVAGEADYRTYARLLRRYGVWYCRGRRYRVRWLDRRPAAGVGRLRDAILRGRIAPRWPSPTPPPVYAVSHAQRIADDAENCRLQIDNGQ